HALRIDIPSGQYAPRFLPRGAPEPPEPSLPPPPDPIAATLVAAAGASSNGHAIPGAIVQTAGRRSRNSVLPLALVLVFCTGAIALWNGAISKTTRVAASPIVNAPARTSSDAVRILAGHMGGDYTDR